MLIGFMTRLKKGVKELSPVIVLLEFFIVFIGVYLAFLFTEYENELERERDRTQVLQIFEFGLDLYDRRFENVIGYHQKYNKQFEHTLKEGGIPDFSAVTYPAPQYSPEVITLLLSNEGFKVFDFSVYLPMTQYANAMERLTYVEEKLVTLSEKYEPLPPPDDRDYSRVVRQQKTLAYTYLRYLNIRASIAKELLGISKRIRGGLDARKKQDVKAE